MNRIDNSQQVSTISGGGGWWHDDDNGENDEDEHDKWNNTHNRQSKDRG